jgi:molybdopterin/thiamine biosynthesis adenylyltransferase
MLPDIGKHGQKKLKNSSILMVGAGGLGSSAAFYLAGAGVGCIGIVDDDVVAKSNLNRQILHPSSSIGESKVISAKKTLNNFNPDIDIKTYPFKFTRGKQFDNLIKDYDLILDCTDNFDTRYAINETCINQKKPWVYGGISEFEGQVMTIIPGTTPCYRCLYPLAADTPEKIAGVMGSPSRSLN